MTTSSPILRTQPLGPQWPTLDPFLFCARTKSPRRCNTAFQRCA